MKNLCPLNLEDLLNKEEVAFGKYKICLAQNKRQIHVFVGESLVFNKPACWFTYWEAEQIVKQSNMLMTENV